MQSVVRAKWMLGIVAFGLFVSGVTVWPAISELNFALSILPESGLKSFVLQVKEGLQSVNETHPYLMYGYDWLAFAHICLSILFLGAIKDPVRNKWIVQCGLIMCALIPVLSLICIPLRGIPFYWFIFDFLFAPGAAIPLVIALRDIIKAEQERASNARPLSA